MLLINEYLMYEIKKIEDNQENNKFYANLKTFGYQLGTKTMMRVCSDQGSGSKSKDVNSILKFFLESYWETFFGKKIEKYTFNENNKVSFFDTDFELVSRASVKGEEGLLFQENVRTVVRHLIEGALNSVFLKCQVEVTSDSKCTQFSIECVEMV